MIVKRIDLLIVKWPREWVNIVLPLFDESFSAFAHSKDGACCPILQESSSFSWLRNSSRKASIRASFMRLSLAFIGFFYQ